MGFEPTNNGFANRRLRPLGYAAALPGISILVPAGRAMGIRICERPDSDRFACRAIGSLLLVAVVRERAQVREFAQRLGAAFLGQQVGHAGRAEAFLHVGDGIVQSLVQRAKAGVVRAEFEGAGSDAADRLHGVDYLKHGQGRRILRELETTMATAL